MHNNNFGPNMKLQSAVGQGHQNLIYSFMFLYNVVEIHPPVQKIQLRKGWFLQFF